MVSSLDPNFHLFCLPSEKCRAESTIKKKWQWKRLTFASFIRCWAHEWRIWHLSDSSWLISWRQINSFSRVKYLRFGPETKQSHRLKKKTLKTFLVICFLHDKRLRTKSWMTSFQTNVTLFLQSVLWLSNDF